MSPSNVVGLILAVGFALFFVVAPTGRVAQPLQYTARAIRLPDTADYGTLP